MMSKILNANVYVGEILWDFRLIFIVCGHEDMSGGNYDISFSKGNQHIQLIAS